MSLYVRLLSQSYFKHHNQAIEHHSECVITASSLYFGHRHKLKAMMLFMLTCSCECSSVLIQFSNLTPQTLYQICFDISNSFYSSCLWCYRKSHKTITISSSAQVLLFQHISQIVSFMTAKSKKFIQRQGWLPEIHVFMLLHFSLESDKYYLMSIQIKHYLFDI